MPEDIRDKVSLNHEDIIGLNFIKARSGFFFRRHYRVGMRSHIMEMLLTDDLEKERYGVLIDGIKSFPRARPLKMLRIFRTRFTDLEKTDEEIARVKIIVKYLRIDCIAQSNEFLVDYLNGGKYECLLCGVQEYVEGEILDPWSPLDESHLNTIYQRLIQGRTEEASPALWMRSLKNNAEKFISRVKSLIMEAGLIADLAGVGNLMLTQSGEIKLVDINNISRVNFDSSITLDDRGYPVCDKSIEALARMEEKLLGSSAHGDDLSYKTFLNPERMKRVNAAEKAFYMVLKPGEPISYAPLGYPSAL